MGRKIPTKNEAVEGEPEERIGTFFLDSGAHSLYTREVIKKGHSHGYAFYETQEFWDYVDSYAEFVKKNSVAIDYYANVDAIFNPKISWKVLKYLENEHGLHPVPVIHYGTDLKWLDKHLEAGYEFIGLGGLGQEVTKDQYFGWADRVYDRLCSGPDRLPCVRTHGFAMTAYDLLIRYPWWSVDSASWVKAASFGTIYIPHKRGGEFTFAVEPYNISVSGMSPSSKDLGKHITTVSKAEAAVVQEWLDKIGVPMGSVNENNEMDEWGVISHHHPRMMANLKFFQAMADSLPPWPWPFKTRVRKGFFDR